MTYPEDGPSIRQVKFKIAEGLDHYGSGGFVNSEETWQELRAEASAIPVEDDRYDIGLTGLAQHIRDALLMPLTDENGKASAANMSMIDAARILGVKPNPTTTASMDFDALTKHTHYTMVNQGKEQVMALRLASVVDERYEGSIRRRTQLVQIGFIAVRGAHLAHAKASRHENAVATATKLRREL